MTSKRFFGVFIAIFVLAALPFVLVQPSGLASAGLANGFSAVIESPTHILLFMMLGLLATLLGRDAVMVLPLSIVVMFLMGGMQLMDSEELRMLPFFTLGGVILVALSLNLVRSKPSLLAALICCSIGFQMGIYYVRNVPDIAMPLFYLIGNALALGLVLGVSVSLGLTLIGDDDGDEETYHSPLERLITALIKPR